MPHPDMGHVLASREALSCRCRPTSGHGGIPQQGGKKKCTGPSVPTMLPLPGSWSTSKQRGEPLGEFPVSRFTDCARGIIQPHTGLQVQRLPPGPAHHDEGIILLVQVCKSTVRSSSMSSPLSLHTASNSGEEA